MVVEGLRLEKKRDHLAPSVPFVRFFVGDDQTPINVIPDFLEEYYEERLTGEESVTLATTAGVVFSGGAFRRAKFILFDPSWDFLENAIIPNKNLIRWEIGWVTLGTGGEFGVTRSGLRIGHVVTYIPTFTWQGNRLEIEVYDTGNFKISNSIYNRFFYQDEDGTIRTTPVETGGTEVLQQGKVNIGDVVQFIADEIGLDTDIAPTEGKFYITQTNQTNEEFIRSIRKFAQDKRGIKDFQFRTEGATLIFKPATTELVRRYWFAKDPLGTMISFQTTINTNVVFSGAWANVKSVGFSPLDKKQFVSEIDVGEVDKQDKKRVQLSKEIFLHTRPTKKTAGRLYVTPYDDRLMVGQYNAAKHREFAKLPLTMKATIIGDPGINQQDHIEIVVMTPSGDVHYTSNVYRLLKVVHRIQRGSFITELTGISDGHRLAGRENFAQVKPEFNLVSDRVKVEQNKRIISKEELGNVLRGKGPDG